MSHQSYLFAYTYTQQFRRVLKPELKKTAFSEKSYSIAYTAFFRIRECDAGPLRLILITLWDVARGVLFTAMSPT